MLASPIFYLYRHALELQLKAVVQPSKPNHQLHPLIDAFKKLLRGRAQGGIPPHLRGDLTTFANVDPEAQGFRFSRTVGGGRRILEGEYWVPLLDLRQFMDEMFALIERARLDLRQ